MAADYENIKGILFDYTRSTLQLYNMVDRRTDVQTLVGFIHHVGHDVRLHTLFTPTELESLWAHIREKELLVDFVLRLRAHLLLRIGRDEWSQLVGDIRNSLTEEISVGGRDNPLCVIDDVLMERLPDEDFLDRVLENNGWVVPLYFLSLTPIVELLDEA